MSQSTITNTDKVKDALITKVNGDMTELFAILDEVVTARDGESSLGDQIDALQALIAALNAASGVYVSATDTTLGYLDGKLLTDSTITATVGNGGGDETLTLSVDSAVVTPQATTSVSGISETATDAEAIARSATDKTITPSNVPSILTVKDYTKVSIEWTEDGVDSTADDSSLITSTNGKIRVKTFAGDSTEDVIFSWPVPEDIVAGSGITFKVHCVVTAATGPSSEGVAFKLSGYSIGNGDALNGTFGTAVESTISSRTDAQYDMFTTTMSGTVTVTDLAAGETVMFKLIREHDNAADTYVQPIGVAFITIACTRLLAP